MKKIFYIAIVFGVLISSCSSPKSDGEKVCKCYQNLDSEVKTKENLLDKASKIGKKLTNECITMQTEFTKKYAQNTDDLKEFNSAIADCITD